MWLEDPLQELKYEAALSQLERPFDSDTVMVNRIHSYLQRHGYINFGIFKTLSVIIFL